MRENSRLPNGFAALEPFVEHWSSQTLSGRDTSRLESSADQRFNFYSVAKEEAQRALEYLDRKPLSEFDDADNKLMRLMQSLIHVALAIEIQGDAEKIHARGAYRLPITHCHSD